MAAEVQIVAAVVNPETLSPSLIITPVQRKANPETTCATIRELSPKVGDINTNKVEPRVTREIVLIPTDFPCHSLSNPIKKPRNTDIIIFRIIIFYQLHSF